MKHPESFRHQNKKTVGSAPPDAAADTNQSAVDFVPSADEVARKAYFSYLNEGSLPGREVQHWLAAEAQLLAERNLTRTHGFHHPN